MYEEYKDLAKRIRKNCLHMCYVGQGGHIGSMLSAADIMAVLYGGGFVTLGFGLLLLLLKKDKKCCKK